MALLGNIGRAGVGAAAGGAKAIGGAAALGTGAFLRQAASPIPGGAAAMTAALGVAGAIGSGALSGFRKGGGAGGNGKDSGSGGGAMVGGLEKLQEGINKLIKINEVGFKDVAIMKNVLIDMRNKAYEDARNRLKDIQGPPIAPTLAAAVDNDKTTSEDGGFGLGTLAKVAAGIAAALAGFLLFAENIKTKLVDTWNAFKNLGIFRIFTKEGRLYKFFGPGGTLAKFFGPKGTLATMADDIKTFMQNNMMTRVISRLGALIGSIGKFIDDMFEKLPKGMRPPRLTPRATTNPLEERKQTRNQNRNTRQSYQRGNVRSTGFRMGPQLRGPDGRFVKNPFQTKPTNPAAAAGADDAKLKGQFGNTGPGAPGPSGLLSGKSKILDAANRAIMWLTKVPFLGTIIKLMAKLGLPLLIGERALAYNSLQNAYEAGDISKDERDRGAYEILGAGLGAVGLGVLGTALGGPVGGIAGSLAGFFGGGPVGGMLYDWFVKNKNTVDPRISEGLGENSYAGKMAQSVGFMSSMVQASESGDPGAQNLAQKFTAMRNQRHTELAESMGIKNIKAASMSHKRFIDAKAQIDADILEQFNKAMAITPSGGANGGTTNNIINNNNMNGGEGSNGSDTNIETIPVNISSNQQDNHDPYGAML